MTEDVRYEKFKRYLDVVYSTVYHEPETPNFHNKLIDLVIKDIVLPLNLDKNSKIIDVGCGSGYYAKSMRELGYNDVLGITLNDEDIEECNKENLPTLKTDFNFIDLPDGYADFIFCRHSMEHSVFPFFTLLEYNRLLKMGSKMYVELPAENTDRNHEENINHYAIMGSKMWGSLFNRAGFDIDFVQEFSFTLNDIVEGETTIQRERFYLCMLTKSVEVL